ncbi:MAG: right-handed parallel beta-helix repeat-containing protein, partial [Lysobacterales bacterium]
MRKILKWLEVTSSEAVAAEILGHSNFNRLVLLGATLLFCASMPLAAATFTVTSTASFGAGTLRSAISQANAAAGADTIVFNVAGAGVRTITLASALPTLSGGLVVDATTQPGYAGTPLIAIDGTGAGSTSHGLAISGNNVTVRGLTLQSFSGDGVRVLAGSGNRIEQSWIGIDPTGTSASPNQNGVWIENAAGNFIGPGNTLSGNRVDGVRINGANSTGNRVFGNRAGTNPAGNVAIANLFNGVVVTGGSGNTIGGSTPADNNVISGNTRSGIGIGAGASSNLVARNTIGLAADGNTVLGNLIDGVLVLDAPNNRIGGDVPGTFNTISGNGGDGIELRGAGATGNLVQRNVIGTSLFGNDARPNQGAGVRIAGAPDNVIGAATPQPNGSNLISGNIYAAMVIEAGAHRTLIQGNRIGTNLDGTQSLANTFGIVIDEADGIRIGVAGNGNLISGNANYGVYAMGSSDMRLESNFIGTRLDGNAALGNGGAGIYFGSGLTPCTNIVIGGSWGVSGNLISGTTVDGFRGDGLLLTCDNVTIKGNRIGTN